MKIIIIIIFFMGQIETLGEYACLSIMLDISAQFHCSFKLCL